MAGTPMPAVQDTQPGRLARPPVRLLDRLDPVYQTAAVAAAAVATALVSLAAGRWLASNPTLQMTIAAAVPIAALPIYTRLALGPLATIVQVGLLTAVLLVVPSSVPGLGWQQLAGGIVGGLLVATSIRRGAVVSAGFAAGLASAVVFLLLAHDQMPAARLAAGAAGSIVGGVIAGAAVLTVSPMAERIFGHVTTMTLHESLSYDHPLLRTLMTAAPGTFLHSTNLAVLCDAGARAIGADALTARVGALFHDIGKTRAPLFFVENQDDDNPHDRLTPGESAAIFRAHVTDGVEMVQRAGLGPRIERYVREHHGTSVMRSIESKAGAEGLDPELLRYPGPRPQSRETGLLMIADQTEATARAVAPDTGEACRELVRTTIARIVAERQLVESGLTERDQETLTAVLGDVIHAMHHRRIAYPEQKTSAAPAAKARPGPLSRVLTRGRRGT